MARAHFVKKARKAIRGTEIKKGDSYWWWKFRYGEKQVSKTQPRPSQLTGSEFLSAVYSVTENLEDVAADREEIKTAIEDAVGQLTDTRDETQDKLDNMPESLQSGPTGELLQSRVEEVDSLINELESLDADDDTRTPEELKDELTQLQYNGE